MALELAHVREQRASRLCKLKLSKKFRKLTCHEVDVMPQSTFLICLAFNYTFTQGTTDPMSPSIGRLPLVTEALGLSPTGPRPLLTDPRRGVEGSPSAFKKAGLSRFKTSHPSHTPSRPGIGHSGHWLLRKKKCFKINGSSPKPPKRFLHLRCQRGRFRSEPTPEVQPHCCGGHWFLFSSLS